MNASTANTTLEAHSLSNGTNRVCFATFATGVICYVLSDASAHTQKISANLCMLEIEHARALYKTASLNGFSIRGIEEATVYNAILNRIRTSETNSDETLTVRTVNGTHKLTKSEARTILLQRDNGWIPLSQRATVNGYKARHDVPVTSSMLFPLVCKGLARYVGGAYNLTNEGIRVQHRLAAQREAAQRKGTVDAQS